MKVPTVGESITEVTISTWLKKDGDFVTLDEIIAEVESDKATFEVPAEATEFSGSSLKKSRTLPIGGLICKIEITEGGAPQKTDGAPHKKAEAKRSATNHMLRDILHQQRRKFLVKKELHQDRYEEQVSVEG
jgi:2-oxoglutarate dehydrogenase E2 component (dihydrolipoamide succinyltransferase)